MLGAPPLARHAGQGCTAAPSAGLTPFHGFGCLSVVWLFVCLLKATIPGRTVPGEVACSFQTVKGDRKEQSEVSLSEL